MTMMDFLYRNTWIPETVLVYVGRFYCRALGRHNVTCRGRGQWSDHPGS